MVFLPVLVLVGLLIWGSSLADDPIVEPAESPWPPERGIVFVGVQSVEYQISDRQAAETRAHHADDYGLFRVTPMRWTPEGLERAHAYTVEARSPGHGAPLLPALAVDHGELFVADGTTIQHYRPFGNLRASQSCKVKNWPTAMATRNGVVYLGSAGEVSAVDFNDGERWEVLYKVPEGVMAKPVDFFLRLGDRLVAVDNVITPKYAFVFERGASGVMTFRYHDSLPGGINGQITHGAVFDDSMLLLARYGGRGGSRRCLFRCQVGGDAVSIETILAVRVRYPAFWRGEGTSEVRVIFGTPGQDGEELAPDAPGAATFTESGGWTGIGVVDDHILLATTGRGILVIDPNAPAAAASVPVGGACGSLLVVGETVLALVHADEGAEKEGDQQKLVAYRWNATTRTLDLIREDRLLTDFLRIAR